MSANERMSVLYVAYPLLTISEDSAGGAEQVLLTLNHRMTVAGHRTTVGASDGSTVPGKLLATGYAVSGPDQYERREREHTAAILTYLHRNPDEFDLIHDMSGSFLRYASECAQPVLATLHLPHSFYRDEWFRGLPPNLFVNCVSEAQARGFSGVLNLRVVQNGIRVERFPFTAEKRNFVLWLGRVCEEKAPHLAIQAAHRAKLPLVLAGQVYPFSYHQQYFEREIKPHISGDSCAPVRFVDSPTWAHKVELLRRARALVLSSTTEETSSLVAMEAMACGTPVVAFRRGAFPEIVLDRVTGYVVNTVQEMAEALTRANTISPRACRARVERYFAAERMQREYGTLYEQFLSRTKSRFAA